MGLLVVAFLLPTGNQNADLVGLTGPSGNQRLALMLKT